MAVSPARTDVAVADRRLRAMNSDVHVIVTSESPGDATIALDLAEAAIADRERRWSRFLEDSELSTINRNPGRPVIVSDDTFDLIDRAIASWEATNGSFDPTVGASLIAAGYDRSFDLLADRTASVPAANSDGTDSHGASIDPAPTPAAIELHPSSRAVVLPPGVTLDLGGIGKGATADAVVAQLLATGTERGGASLVDGCCVNIGGDLRAAGRAPDERGWTVTLDCPGADTTRAVAIADGAICTSTISKRTWIGASGPEHHLRNPATGASLQTGVVSATVIAARAEQAEVLAKAAIAAGPSDAGRLLVTQETTGLVVLDDATIVELPGFDRYVLA